MHCLKIWVLDWDRKHDRLVQSWKQADTISMYAQLLVRESSAFLFCQCPVASLLLVSEYYQQSIVAQQSEKSIDIQNFGYQRQEKLA